MMKYNPNRSRTFLTAVGTVFIRLRPLWVLAAMFVALELFAGSSVAQKSVGSPTSDPSGEQAYSSPARLRNDAGQDISRLFKQYTIKLAADCSQDALRAYMAQLAVGNRMKQAPLQMGNQIGILVEEATSYDLMAAPCVLEIVPGWQLSASSRLDVVDLSESRAPEIPLQTAAAAGTGGISGTVTADTGAVPLSDIYVCAYLGGQNGSWQAWIGCEYSDAQGQYDIGYLPGGIYRVEFYDPTGVYLREFYNDAVDIDSGADVIVTAGSTTSGINAALSNAGHITGFVTAEFDSAPLEFIDVCAYQFNGLYWQGAGCGSTYAAGFYDIGGLATGDYRVLFSDTDNGYYLREYYNDAADIESAVNIAVTAGSTTTAIDAARAEPGHIAGTVTIHPSGVPLEAVEVCAFTFDGADWLDAGCDVTDVNGDYDIGGLPPGAYRVSFSDLFQFYVREFYNDVLDIENGTDISVTSGNTTLGINAALAEGGQITDTVTTEGGSPLQDIAACAYGYNGAGWLWVLSTCP